jgi:microcystin-dependent protein
MSNPFLGEIQLFGGNFAPRGWALCSGQLLPISQNDALYSLVGTTYGGDGQVTFGLPDLRGRRPVSQGQGPNLSNYVLGQVGGVEAVTLSTPELPGHTHQVLAVAGTASASSPAANAWAAWPDNQYTTGSPSGQLAAASTAVAGGNQSHDNLSPYLVVNFIIALQGVYPSRN